MATKLPQHTEDEIQKLVDTGEFDDSTDVLVQGVHLLIKRREKLAHLRALIQEGVDEADRGETVEVTPEFRRELRESARRLAHSGEPLDPNATG